MFLIIVGESKLLMNVSKQTVEKIEHNADIVGLITPKGIQNLVSCSILWRGNMTGYIGQLEPMS